MNVKPLAYSSLMCVMLVLSGWLTVPSVVPFTLQTLVLFLSVGLLGAKHSTLAVAGYLALGALGLPVFAGMQGGPGVLFGPTGGYLLGFLFISPVTGRLMERSQKPVTMILAMLAGLMVCYGFGTVWFVWGYANSPLGFFTAMITCVAPFILPDIVKILLAVGIIKKLKPILNQKVG